jgi:hypothetical protein
MFGKLEFARLKIPSDITIFDIPNIKKELKGYDKEVLALLYDSMTAAIDDRLSDKCKGLIREEDLFELDEAGREQTNRACLVRQFLVEAIDEIIVPFLAGKSTSPSGHTSYMEFEKSMYAVSSCNSFSYKSMNNDVIRLNLLSAVNILELFKGLE